MFPGRCVPAGLSNVKHLLLRKTDVLKTSIFSKKKLIKCTSFEEQKGTRHIRGKAFFGIIVFSRLSLISFNLFFSGDKRLLSEFLREWGWFHGHNERFPKYLGYKLKFQKSETPFADERATITRTWTFSCHWKILFCLRKKRPENAFVTLTVNYRKIVQKNNLCHSKQPSVIVIYYSVLYCTILFCTILSLSNILFSNIWSYSVIGCFDWRIGVFQQTVVRVYYILK